MTAVVDKTAIFCYAYTVMKADFCEYFVWIHKYQPSSRKRQGWKFYKVLGSVIEEGTAQLPGLMPADSDGKEASCHQGVTLVKKKIQSVEVNPV